MIRHGRETPGSGWFRSVYRCAVRVFGGSP